MKKILLAATLIGSIPASYAAEESTTSATGVSMAIAIAVIVSVLTYQVGKIIVNALDDSAPPWMQRMVGTFTMSCGLGVWGSMLMLMD